jgi:radical SAM superfamily enzyme YgiQ (UPF0313 family)
VEVAALVASHPELQRLMTEAGVEASFLGLETDNEKVLRRCGKMQNVGRDLVADSLSFYKHGMLVYSGLMTGLDGDDPETFADRMISFVESANIAIPMVGAVQAQPGTLLYEQKKGLLRSDAVNNTDCRTNFVPEMDIEHLERETRRIVKTVNSWAVACERICSILEKLDVSKRPPKRLRYTDLRAFLRSIMRIGIFGGKDVRQCYWKVLCFAWRKNRAAFAEAVKLLIFNWHFHRSEKS